MKLKTRIILISSLLFFNLVTVMHNDKTRHKITELSDFMSYEEKYIIEGKIDKDTLKDIIKPYRLKLDEEPSYKKLIEYINSNLYSNLI